MCTVPMIFKNHQKNHITELTPPTVFKPKHTHSLLKAYSMTSWDTNTRDALKRWSHFLSQLVENFHSNLPVVFMNAMIFPPWVCCCDALETNTLQGLPVCLRGQMSSLYRTGWHQNELREECKHGATKV